MFSYITESLTFYSWQYCSTMSNVSSTSSLNQTKLDNKTSHHNSLTHFTVVCNIHSINRWSRAYTSKQHNIFQLREISSDQTNTLWWYKLRVSVTCIVFHIYHLTPWNTSSKIHLKTGALYLDYYNILLSHSSNTSISILLSTPLSHAIVPYTS